MLSPTAHGSKSNQTSQLSFGEASSSFGLLPGFEANRGENCHDSDLGSNDDESQIDRSLDVIRKQVEQDQNLTSQEFQHSQPNVEDPPQRDVEYNSGLENPEDDEFSIERQMRLAREEEEGGGSLHRRLVAPPSEIRRRNTNKQKQIANRNENPLIIEALRKKQSELVDLQINTQKILFENAKIAQAEAKEKYLLSRMLRVNAEASSNSNNSQ